MGLSLPHPPILPHPARPTSYCPTRARLLIVAASATRLRPLLRGYSLCYTITASVTWLQVLNEDAHVTHHKYPGTHWSNTATLLNKHKDDFDQAGSAGTDHPDGYGSVFTNTHVFEVG